MATPKLALIVAADNDGGIGYRNNLPWRLKGDLKHFKIITHGNAVIMGRNTRESLPGPLEGRINIVVSSQAVLTCGNEGVTVVPSVEAALEEAKRYGTDWIFFIGGAKIYEAAMPLVERAYVTLVHKKAPIDTWIKDFRFPPQEWVLESFNNAPPEIDESTGLLVHSHTYLTFKKKNGVSDAEQHPQSEENLPGATDGY